MSAVTKRRGPAALVDDSPAVSSGYKRTEAGVLPEDWVPVPLGELFVFKNGLNKAKGFFGFGSPIVNYMDVYGRPGLRIVDIHGRVSLNSQELKNFEVRQGDVFFTRTSETVEEIGVASVMLDQPTETVFSGFVLRARPKNDWLDDAYKQYCFATPEVRFQVVSTSSYTTRALTNGRSLSAVFVAVPTRAEQRAIAEALSDVDGLLGALEALIAKKRAIKQAAMQQLLTGKTRLPGFDRRWETKRLGEIANIKTGGRNNEDKVEDGEYPFFVRSDKVEWINGYSHDCEAILVPGEGRIGEIFHYIHGRFDVHQRVYAITQFAPSISASFLHHYMAMHFGTWAMQHTVKATVDSLRLPTFQSFELLMPTAKVEQTAIATVLADMDAEIAVLERRHEKTRALKKCMMQQLLSGRVRLGEPELSATAC